jgi:hypothetical protein
MRLSRRRQHLGAPGRAPDARRIREVAERAGRHIEVSSRSLRRSHLAELATLNWRFVRTATARRFWFRVTSTGDIQVASEMSRRYRLERLQELKFGQDLHVQFERPTQLAAEAIVT